MSHRIGRLRFWLFALCAAFPRALGGRCSTDYYSQSVPRGLLLPKPVCPSSGETTWFPGSCLVTEMGSGWLRNTFPRMGGLRAEPSTGLSGVSGLPLGHCGFASHRYSLGYSSPGRRDRVGQPWVGHVSPSPITG